MVVAGAGLRSCTRDACEWLAKFVLGDEGQQQVAGEQRNGSQAFEVKFNGQNGHAAHCAWLLTDHEIPFRTIVMRPDLTVLLQE